MRGYSPAYQVKTPQSLSDALEILAAEPGRWTPLAGGTDLMVLFESGYLQAEDLLNIWGLDELRGISELDDRVILGSLTTYSHVREHPLLNEEFPMLCQAARESGALAIQNRGTLGGNIVNASPAADSPPALLVYDAEIELSRSTGSRTRSYNGFHSGYKIMDRQPDELLTSITLPRDPQLQSALHFYRKVGTRKAQAISKVAIAAVGRVDQGSVSLCRVALASVAPIPLRCHHAEAELVGKRLDPACIDRAVDALLEDISPIDDVRSTQRYRERVSQNLLRAFLNELAGR